MNSLKDKYEDFKELDRYRFVYSFEGGRTMTFFIYKKQFPHLVGLHKLTDISLIARFNDDQDKKIKATNILSAIREEIELNESVIKASSKFNEIQKRYDLFTKNIILSLSKSDVIVDFDPSLIATKLKSKYLFYEKTDNGYLHLGIVNNGKEYILETFFVEPTDYYIKEQKTLKIVTRKVFDSKGILIEEK